MAAMMLGMKAISCAKTAETCGMPNASAAIVRAIMKTNQNTSLPITLAGV